MLEKRDARRNCDGIVNPLKIEPFKEWSTAARTVMQDDSVRHECNSLQGSALFPARKVLVKEG